MQAQVTIPFPYSADGLRTRWLKAGEFVEIEDAQARDLIERGYLREPKTEKAASPKAKYR